MNFERFQKSNDFYIKGEWVVDISDVDKTFISEITTEIDKNIFLKLELMEHKFFTIAVGVPDLVHPIELSIGLELQSESFDPERVFSKMFFSSSHPERLVQFSIDRDALKNYVFDETILKINYEIEHRDAMNHANESFSRFFENKLPSPENILNFLNLSQPSFETILPPRLMYKANKPKGIDSLIEAFFSIVYRSSKLLEEMRKCEKDNDTLLFIKNCKSIDEFNVQNFKNCFTLNGSGNDIIKQILEEICIEFDEDKFTVNELLYYIYEKEKKQFFLEVNYKRGRNLYDMIKTNYENCPTIRKSSVTHYPEFLFILIDSTSYFEFSIDFITPYIEHNYTLKGIITKIDDSSNYIAYTAVDSSETFTKHDEETLEIGFVQIQEILKDENSKEKVKMLFYERQDKIDVLSMI